MKILQDSSNALLKRRELVVRFEVTSNPGYAVVQKQIAEHFKSSEDLVVVRKINSGFGKHTFDVEASIYATVQAKDHTERKPKVKEKKQ